MLISTVKCSKLNVNVETKIMEQGSNDVSPTSPPKNIVEAKDYELELPAWSTECLKTAAVQHRIVRPRSLSWAVILNAVPTISCEDVMKSMKAHRNYYNDLKSKMSMDPRAVIGDDPLSQNDESAWKQHFCDNELKALILQDVVRTFPDEVYFRDKDVQDMMVRVLFFWARSHSTVGYRQGMHEVLAPLLFELYSDRKYAPAFISETLRCYLDDSYLEHDSYMLFSTVMKGLEKFYTTGDIVPSSCGRLPTSKIVHNPNEVVRYLERVREEYLVPLDGELAAHLASCNITMELFGIRWLRLLFGREFPRTEIPHLWGFLFTDGPLLPHIHYVIVAMLISMRTTLLDPDAGVVLAALMRPSAPSAGHVCALAQHLRRPLDHPRPPTPPHAPRHPPASQNNSSSSTESFSVEHVGSDGAAWGGDSGSEGVAEGADVARELAALALVRARLPAAAHALALALPRPPPDVAQPLHHILQLAALLQCRNHALIDVETALEAAEGQNTDRVGRRQLVPVAVIGGKRAPIKQASKQANKQVNKQANKQVKEVQLKVFHQAECVNASDLPCLDPLGLRTE